jgi:hypothetical protein
MLSTQSERPRTTRKAGYVLFLIILFPLQFIFIFSPQTRLHDHHHFQRGGGEVQLNEEELRQMAMRTHDTITHLLPTAKTVSIIQPSTASTTTTTPAEKATNPSGTSSKVDPRNDGTLSDSVLSSQPESNKKRRPSMSSKALVILGLSKKTNSASNLGLGKCQKQKNMKQND